MFVGQCFVCPNVGFGYTLEGGKSYKVVELGSANEGDIDACCSQCGQDLRCDGWKFVSKEFEGTANKCFLYNGATGTSSYDANHGAIYAGVLPSMFTFSLAVLRNNITSVLEKCFDP